MTIDAICRGCNVGYTFANALASNCERWQEFCCNTCRDEFLSRGDGPATSPSAIVVLNIDLRDYFAGQALTGIIAHHGMPDDASKDRSSELAYDFADSMLKAREAPPRSAASSATCLARAAARQ